MKKIIRIIGITILLAIAIISILLLTDFICILKIESKSMEPNLKEDDIVILAKQSKLKKGDIVAFKEEDNILIKRIIALEGEIVHIDNEGEVYVNSSKIQENYIENLSYGDCDIKFPYQVPENSVFVLGDNREESIDSRKQLIGSISIENVIGKIIIKLKPFEFY